MRRLLLPLALLTLAAHAQQSSPITGYFREPGGSVIHIAPCSASGPSLCLTLVTLPPNPPSTVDHHNPDATLRTRPLCGLRIGYDFHPTTPDHADDGRLYDPRAGKTYHGEMTLQGDTLHLRGYLGFKALGRTETWTRTTQPPTPCPKP